MALSHKNQSLFISLCLLIAMLSAAQSLKLDLNAICSESALEICTISNISVHYDDPLRVTRVKVPALKVLLIRNSLISYLPSDLFEQSDNLETFIMHSCGLNRIYPTDFEKAGNLKKLVLQHNRISSIPEKVFANLSHLEQLVLGHNTIHMIHKTAFTGLESLKYLDLQLNGLRTLPENLFADLLNVEHIDLSHNEIESVDATTFAKNTQLHTLLLNDNKFSIFEPNSLLHLNHLHLLDLSNTVLEELYLQSVDLLQVQNSGLRICRISGGVVKLKAANNNLKSLNITDKLSVQSLELHGNYFETLNDFEGMLNMQRLDISKNQLQSLRTVSSPLFMNFPNLLHLNLATNRLQNLTAENFISLQKLTYLDLAFNRLGHLEVAIFDSLMNLEKLYIEGNDLHYFDYVQFKKSHEYLRECGVFENDWNFRYFKKMLAYLRDHGVHLPMRFTPTDTGDIFGTTEPTSLRSSLSSSNDQQQYNEIDYADAADAVDILTDVAHAKMSAASSNHLHSKPLRPLQHNSLIGVTGIHPYWTTRDVLALLTLLIVLLILLVQLYRILQEEQCFPQCCLRLFAHRGQEAEPLNPRQRRQERNRLDEEDSEV